MVLSNAAGAGGSLTEGNSEINAVVNRGIDNTGVADVSTALGAITTAMCALATPPPLYLPTGTYKINSGWLISATSTTCGGLDIGGRAGDAVVLQTDCSGNSYGLWYNNTTNSGDNFTGSRIHDLTIKDTSGTGACQDLLKLTQMANVKVERVTLLNAKGKTYSTGTISSTGATVTGVGTTWTSAMVHGELQITTGGVPFRAEICTVTPPTTLTLCSTAFPNGNIGAGTAYAIAYGGRALACDPGFSFSQYGTISDLRAFGNMFAIFAYGGASGGCSRFHVYGMGGHIRASPGSRVTNSEGVHLGKGSDTWDLNIPINDVSVGYTLDSAHANIIRGDFEVNATLAPVTTCNGGTGLQACVTGAEVSAESNGHGWSNHFADPYFYLVGNVYQFDNSTGAHNSIIEGDRTLNGQYTQHYYFYGTTGCPAPGSGVAVILSTYDCAYTSAVSAVSEFDNGTCTTAKTITPVNGTEQLVTLTNAQTCVLTFTAPVSGTTTIALRIKQSTSGSFDGLISTPSVLWPGGIAPVITSASGAEDFIVCKYRPTAYRCSASQDFR
jgi:hypothetical protein